MRYISFVKRIFFATILVGLLSGVLFSPSAHAAGVVYTVDDGNNITFSGLDLGEGGATSATIKKGNVQSSGVTCYKANGSAATVMLKISNNDKDSIASGKAPDSLSYSKVSTDPNLSGSCMDGGKATLDSATNDSKIEESRVGAAAEYLLGKAPDLKKEGYIGKLSENEVNKALADCISSARSQAAQADSLNQQAGKPAKTAEETKSLHNDYFSSCYANKTGTAKSKILNYINAQSANENIILEASVKGGDARDAMDDELNPDAKEEITCESTIPGLGWIICGVIQLTANLNDGMWSLVENLLTVDPLEQSGSYYDLWKVIRNVSNALLVVAFIIIVYSQLTGVGVSNYGIKTRLPRLIIAAILINVSYFVVSIAIDVFNIGGSALNGLMDDVYGGMSINADFGWEAVIPVILTVGAGAGAAAVVGGSMTLLILLLPAALAGMLGFLAALITLMFRQAILPLLAILAPLAFVALLLPNTESLFTKWRKMVTSMLMLYPLAALLFGGMKIAGAAISSDGNAFNIITGLTVMAAPLFMLPFLAKQAGSMAGALNGKLQGLVSKTRKPMGEWAGGKAALSRARYDAKPIRTRDKSGKTFLRDRVRSMRRGTQYRRREDEIIAAAYGKQADAEFNERFAGNAESVSERMGSGDADAKPTVAQRYIKSIGATMQSTAEEEEIKQLVAQFRSEHGVTGISEAGEQMAQAILKGDVAKARAMQQYLDNAGTVGAKQLNSVYSGKAVGEKLTAQDDTGRELYAKLGGDAVSSGIKSKSAAIDKFFTAGQSSADFNSIKNDQATYSGLSGATLASQADLESLVNDRLVGADAAQAILQSSAAGGVGVTTRASLQEEARDAIPAAPIEVKVINNNTTNNSSTKIANKTNDTK